MQHHELDDNEVIARLQAQAERQQQLQTATQRVMSLYAYEHQPLAVAREQHQEIAPLWENEYATNSLDPEVGDRVRQLGRVLGFVYELQGDSAYTIADRLAVRRAAGRQKKDGDGKGRQEVQDPLTERFVDDIILARAALEGNVRNSKRISAIAQDTRQTLGNKPFETTVRTVLEKVPTYFPTPLLSRRLPQLRH